MTVFVGDHTLRHVKPAGNYCSLFGLPGADVADLLRAGYLKPAAQGGYDVASRLASLLSHSKAIELPGRSKNVVSLASARFALDRRLVVPWSRLLDAVLDGSVPIVGVKRARGNLLSNIMLDDFDALASVIKDLSSDERENVRGFLTQSEVANIFGKSRSLARDLIKSGILSPAATVGEIVTLRARYFFSFELKDLAIIHRGCDNYIIEHLRRAGIAAGKVGATSLWPHGAAKSYLADKETVRKLEWVSVGGTCRA